MAKSDTLIPLTVLPSDVETTDITGPVVVAVDVEDEE